VKNEVLPQVKVKISVLHALKPREVNWNGHILHGNSLLKRVVEGTIESMRKRRIRLKQLLDDLEVKRRYWNRREEALARPRSRTDSGRVVDLSVDSLGADADGGAPLPVTLDSCSYTFPYAKCLMWNPYKRWGIQRRLV